jgi:hypothetical protein
MVPARSTVHCALPYAERIRRALRAIKMNLHDANFTLLENRFTVAEVIRPKSDELLGVAESADLGESLTERFSPTPECFRVVR